MPRERFYHYVDNRKKNSYSPQDLSSEGIHFCGAHDLAKFSDKSVDVFINIASFQEMTLEQVDSYFDLIDKKVKGMFYTQQLWTSKTHGLNHGEIFGFPDYPWRPYWTRLYLRNASWSDLYFETAFLIDR
jgi:hypothetical protein